MVTTTIFYKSYAKSHITGTKSLVDLRCTLEYNMTLIKYELQRIVLTQSATQYATESVKIH